MMDAVTTAVTTLVTTSGKSGKSKPSSLSERKQWYLVGLCQGTSLSVIPPVWGKMFKSATYGDALDVFENALVEENDRVNAGAKKPVVFESDVRRMLGLDHSTYENFCRDTRRNVVLGLSDFFPRTQKEIRARRDHDQIIKSTPEDSMDYELINKLRKLEKGDKEPTTKISILISGLKGYCNSLRVRFTTACPHYQACFEMLRILEGWTEVKQEEVLNLLRILALQWRIDEDYYSYCAQKKTKEDLQGVVPCFLRSYL